ncbi:MAG: molybdopterin-dependent oxidoreductase [Desulfobacterales bacterium]
MRKEKSAVCGCCFASPGCGVIVSFDENERIAEIRPDEDAPLPYVCRIGRQAKDIVYSPERLLHPLKRIGPKGTYRFEKISWDEAYDLLAEKIVSTKDAHGPESLAVYTGRGCFERSFCDIMQPRNVAVSSAAGIFFPLGSPNTLGAGAYCYVSFAMIAPHVTMGAMKIDMFSDLENADLIVVWGTNPATSSPPITYDRIKEASEEGARIIVIDPRKTSAASLPGGHWVPIRPGTDGALALAMSHVLIHEERYDRRFAEDWCLGFEEFADYAEKFPPDVAEKITGIPKETIIWLSREIAAAEGAAPVMYTGLEYTPSGVQNIRAAMIFWALAGQLDVPGGRCFTMKENIFPVNRRDHIPNPAPEKALGRKQFPLYHHYRAEAHAMALPKAVLDNDPYPVRFLMIMGGSILTAWPDPVLWRRTLGALDFLVCVDRQFTSDAAYADLVLPAATGFEIDSYCYYGSSLRVRERVIDPCGESKGDYEILAELADRLGYGHLYPRSHEEILTCALKGSPFRLDDLTNNGGILQMPYTPMVYRKWEKGLLRQDGKPGFNTPSGKFEISSSILAHYGYDPLPKYEEPRESPLSNPELAREYPLVFNSGALIQSDFRTSFRSIPELIKERPEPTVTINVGDASRRGIQSGDTVVVKTLRGQVTVAAIVSDRIAPGYVDVSTGGGGPLGPPEWQRCNVNELTDIHQYDPVSGFPVYKALLCQVVKKRRKRRKLSQHIVPTLGCGT